MPKESKKKKEEEEILTSQVDFSQQKKETYAINFVNSYANIHIWHPYTSLNHHQIILGQSVGDVRLSAPHPI